MKKYAHLLLGAVTGLALATSEAKAELIDGVNKDIVCKRPKTVERQLKLHSCATMQYPLAPLAPAVTPPDPEPIPPYSS